MADFYTEILEGKVRRHDRSRFELKLDYLLRPKATVSRYALELYFFVPKTLLPSKRNYSREQFYNDFSSLVRFKTPQIPLEILANPKSKKSSWRRMKDVMTLAPAQRDLALVRELKLFSNIFRSQIRDSVFGFIREAKNLNTKHGAMTLEEDLRKFSGLIEENLKLERKMEVLFRDASCSAEVLDVLLAVDEFCIMSLEYYISALLLELDKKSDFRVDLAEARSSLEGLLAQEIASRREKGYLTCGTEEDSASHEAFIYKKGIFKKWSMDILLLSLSREDVGERYGYLAGVLGAGVAMLIYMLLFIWQGSAFVVNSLPFVLASVVFYIIKDRIKEYFKEFYHREFSHWFPDYKVNLIHPETQTKIGHITESFSFLSRRNLPKKVTEMRMEDLSVLEREGRPEKVFRYHKEVFLKNRAGFEEDFWNGLNDILRFDVSSFLRRASEPRTQNFVFDASRGEPLGMKVPKAYHINIVVKMSDMLESGEIETRWNRIRLVVDKNGIERMDQIV
ncbi:MAG: hypothetical protein G01um101418_981 [Parcubacteria group bacterium Gr01-1014_18]|nr:MAG: hypothetical protein Greene041636_984 [Parcubacteria group bacterium Greene0416_36]TSC79422.1 MAG: hypothetical protein G01um101418_981 [Parcubacteria group bacterium Gr01-1014_18]TSC97804.1 MAG: hypothetical protein Greene101420_991 [Parcubacteria group bacterium Greene1014_20]TSD06014.1 MAG: hypothetical protein Greene07142_962 [Parcubacteria group bacterium Greene0714_2]